ncbi:WAT1-related protein At5g40240 isoform X3 [Brassica rapa]|uniref:WAT1-related protein At5g40240 isoform X3 n=1 Tax=Brassica campestris TaxID=3711 RepID=UPI0006AAD54B|nr:WAT1-related protein At5g40240 isoform X3 [Brassica rapa]
MLVVSTMWIGMIFWNLVWCEVLVSGNLDTKSVMRRTGEETVAWRYFHKDVVPFAAMFAVECSTVGSNTLYKAASLRGLNFYVFIFYSYAASTLVLLPLALIFGRSKKLPSAKSPLFFKMFLLGLFGCMAQMVGFKGVEQSSPTLSSAMSNLTPAFTFTLAVIFRMEQVVLRSSATQAKIIGGVLSISGALVVVLYKGPKVLSAAIFTPSLSPTNSLHQQLTSSESSWIVGGLLLASQFFLVSVWYIVQTLIMEVYPEEITVVFFYYLFATLISAPICLLAERNLTSWVIKPDITLVAIIYSGVFASLFSVITHTWGLHLKGPVYVSLFRPLSIAIAVAMGAIFLSDALHLGSVIGSVILCFGFYTVIWGKSREDSTKTLAGSEHCSPLLLTHVVEDEGLSLR